jgi:uncharacterized protein DUF5367
MQRKFIILGFIFWLAATLALRAVGQRVLPDGRWLNVVILYAISFVAMASVVRIACIRARLVSQDWPVAAVSLLLPTLLLDPFSSAFFPVVFPNMAPERAGVFGGWMIICCAGGLLGGLVRRTRGSAEPYGPARSS